MEKVIPINCNHHLPVGYYIAPTGSNHGILAKEEGSV
jgi:hypothetical protein